MTEGLGADTGGGEAEAPWLLRRDGEYAPLLPPSRKCHEHGKALEKR